ncbi:MULTISPECIES: sugar-binding transcriptional regulator [unclassified Mesorhizobium]|uniref:sugar-binding transcriptional regulator n=1 Tax=unclassified Mesorhizobium TaxID=325217 RepID=UPI000FDA8A78|nr:MULTISPECIES: sugar-binding transcriptional regulator [unclassified Mesorhizobium]TGR44128.1 sugar-binding transcriptional regulator [bacterium M00.F.Ca.ET.199.01.1.1]TGU32994.1 sugar-binding transcriptional regulator [bacterium M00.F.Ca.ET.156.01.1.1]TGV87200.1 sugar-binding transcriptional regulator [Mesorhizobium sp. M00.F.Ca.ET.149.01.1.1]TIU48901.1 MAG: sugar-binding transcriptional regulator [Mesorhizobium sp.]TGQ91167.1 sugar-binding transcriptional regulator [Mesorhizobium sp. M8A.F
MAIRPAEQLIHKAAWLYYAHGLRQDEVANQLNISRASVAMYLRKARETGIVNISTSTQLFTDDVMARRLEDALKLDAVWIAPENAYLADPSTDIAVLAASVFLELVRKGDRIGVAWGRTVYTIADIMSYADLQDVTVVQLCGNLGAPYSYRPDQCTMEIARRLNAKGLNFYAPLVLSTEALAQGLRAEPVIRDQLAGISDCDLALYSIGAVDADSHLVKCGALTAAEMAALRKEGAAGVIAGQIIDAGGELLDCSYNRRVISAGLASLRVIGKRLMVVQEDSKFEPLLAAIAGGLCTHLVVGAHMAQRLLDHAGTSAEKAS